MFYFLNLHSTFPYLSIFLTLSSPPFTCMKGPHLKIFLFYLCNLMDDVQEGGMDLIHPAGGGLSGGGEGVRRDENTPPPARLILGDEASEQAEGRKVF